MDRIQSLIFAVLLVLTAEGSVGASPSYDIREKTPEIQQAISSRQERFSSLKQKKSQGEIGENNRGYVEAFGGPESSSLADSENRDRSTLYRAIVDQNQLGSSGLSQVEAVFAEVQRDKASPGEKIQLPSGTWTQK